MANEWPQYKTEAPVIKETNETIYASHLLTALNTIAVMEARLVKAEFTISDIENVFQNRHYSDAEVANQIGYILRKHYGPYAETELDE